MGGSFAVTCYAQASVSLLRKQMVESLRRSFWGPVIVLGMLAIAPGEENKLVQHKALGGQLPCLGSRAEGVLT